MAKGFIKKLITDRGFGFIQTAEGTDLFFHRTELQGAGFLTLREGQEVEYEMAKERDGRSQAVRVRPTEDKVKDELPSAEEITEAPEATEDGSTEGT